MSELAYYQSLEDYEDIIPYLQLDPEGFEVPFEEPPLIPNYENAVVIDNIPVTSSDKIPKLSNLLLSLFAKFCSKLKLEDIIIPIDPDTKSTYGFCFAKFNRKEEVEHVLQPFIEGQEGAGMDGFKMGKGFFKLSRYSDLDKYAAVSDEFVAPDLPPFKPKPDPRPWLLDPLNRDQFVIRAGTETEIMWASATEGLTPIFDGEREKVATGRPWCENRVSWSPQGTYIASFHAPGIKLWGTEDFTLQGRYLHKIFDDMEFSPCEKFMITYRMSQSGHDAEPSKAIVVWNIQSGEAIKTFKLKNPLDHHFQVQATITEQKVVKEKAKEKGAGEVGAKGAAGQDTKIVSVQRVIRGRVVSYDDYAATFTIREGNEEHKGVPIDTVKQLQEPNRFKWSPDGKYCARVSPDIISVYVMNAGAQSEMALLDQKSIAAKDVLDFVWAPKGNVISYWSPAVGNHPATINILQLPSRKELCSRKFFDVSDGRMIWQKESEYLCVKMQNKKRATVLVFFRMNEVGVPVEQLEFAEHVQNVHWEPSGDRFVVTLGERNPTLAFYSMSGTAAATGGGTSTAAAAKSAVPSRKEIVLLYSLPSVHCNDVLWSPAGGIVALPNYSGDSCTFVLHDVDNNLKLATREHQRSNKLIWDPTGRMIASCTMTSFDAYMKSPYARGYSDDGFNIYSFQGNLLTTLKREKMLMFQWRPRPKDLLTVEDKRNILKPANFKKYEKKFDLMDRRRLEELNQEIISQRREMAAEVMAIIARNRSENAMKKNYRIAMRDGYDSDDDKNYNMEVQVVELVL